MGALARQAVVIGAGMGGLAAAGALAPWFEQVTVIERDALPDQPAQRLGTLQGRHVHALLAGGQQALESLFPGFNREIVAAGAVPVNANSDVRFETPGYDPFPARDFGWTTVCMSRPLLEFVVRRLAQRANVTFRSRCRAKTLEVGAGGAIAAVVCEADSGGTERLAADLVVDASGRAGPTLRLLSAIGRPAPAETIVGVDFAYASAVFERPSGATDDWKVLMTGPKAPEGVRGGLLAPIENGQWILSVAGRGEDTPPEDEAGFMAFVKGLRTPSIFEAVREARRVGEIARYGFRESGWRRFEASSLPEGLIPFADSICRFNPVYGQGMSLAAQEGVMLSELLGERAENGGGLAGLTATFLDQAQPLIKGPWDMSTTADFIYPLTRGERPANLDQIFAYAAAFGQLAAEDPEVHRLDAEVRALLKPPAALVQPELVARVMARLAEMQSETGAKSPEVPAA